MLYRILMILMYLPLKLFFPTRVVGRRNIPKKGRVILAGNHQSYFDAPIVAINTRRKIRFIAKKELFEKQPQKAFYSALGAISIDRNSHSLTAIKTGLKVLKNDNALGIFPSGRRGKEADDTSEFKNGIAMFAVKGKAPIVPIIFVKKPRFFRFNKVVIGKPIQIEDFGAEQSTKDLLNSVTKVVSTKMQEMLAAENVRKKKKGKKSKK